MKLSIISCLLIAGCVSTQPASPVPSAVEGPPPPFPDDIQVVSRPNYHEPYRETAEEEQARYEQSVRRIEFEIAEEVRLLAECELRPNHGFTCEAMKRGFCQFDTLIDSRGYAHLKKHCFRK